MDISGYNRNEAVREEKRAAENTAKNTAKSSPERPGEGTARYLFTTSTCPNCRTAREMLAEEPYEVIDARSGIRNWYRNTGFSRPPLWWCWTTGRPSSM